ncbi:L,D-transpeptidase family protein [Bradyrhizobium cenepequi]|uniref:L,D-transpeptidase family protein n=1 Tax=Bradyrhizobium cenepequi TaxID=2821403 RepID=UPI001CE25F5D|nr:L,D-transpeptidase family protein [Bradyrhizobium cenepequi]MCA6106764.1 L,D-transpeptidase family protein [Bradyrhizobium cenepequi]
MISRFVKRKRNQPLRPAYLLIAALAALIAAGDHAGARGGRSERRVESVESRIAGDPLMAIVSLQDQRITVYDSNGWILRAPVSSGQKGRETPAGIFSIIQKEAEHYSNLYDDAYMPHMQRITWSGIALHGGPLPGYAASHGCVRMPFDFAERLFENTRLGLRVIVAPTDVAPVEIAHPALLKPKPDVVALAAARRAEADEAAVKADQARLASAKAYRESTQAMMPVRVAENLKRRAETQLAAAEAALGSATSPESKEQAERAKAQAATRIAELQEQWAAAKAELQPKLDAVTTAREAALAAENARIAAAEAARQAARELEPVSVLISRKTQRLYVRRAFEPILESPVTIQDPDRPIGTHVFTATEQTDGGTGIRWSVVSFESSRPNVGIAEAHDPARGHRRHEVEPKKTEPSAIAALDRVAIPQDVLDRIAGATPRSSLVITDEALSSETGKGTDFVVVMSGEPQGGIKMRRRAPPSEFPYARARDRRPFWSPPFAGPFSTW